MSEVWKPVVGFEGFYEVSDEGRVRSIDRVTSDGRRVKGRVLRPHSNGRYLYVGLCMHGIRRMRSIHSLVAEAFIGPRPDGHEIAHGPNGSLNNTASNIRYGSKESNEADKQRDGTAQRGETHYRASITEPDVQEMRRSEESLSVLAKRYRTSRQNISAIRNRKRWRHIR